MGKLTIAEIAKILEERNGLDHRAANRFASEMFAVILERLQQGEQVKVKGLGSWKIIDVEARESVSVRTGERVVIDSHPKVTFTPDATMKELVNKPFSQFETVVLNEGVEFEDLRDDVTEEELAAEVSLENVVEEDSVQQEEVVAIPEPARLVEIVDEQSVIEPVNEPVDEPVNEPVEEPIDEAGEESVDESVEEEESHWGRWLLCGFGVLALMAASALGGYYYGIQQQPSVLPIDTVFVTDTIFAEPVDTVSVENLSVVNEEPQKEQEPEPKGESPLESKVERPATQDVADPYAAKDVRVRLGAYRIVGLDHEVKVLEGQTFYSICRAHLGPDMECYVEVYNNLPRDPKIKAGQTIKIPKLQLKKRRK